MCERWYGGGDDVLCVRVCGLWEGESAAGRHIVVTAARLCPCPARRNALPLPAARGGELRRLSLLAEPAEGADPSQLHQVWEGEEERRQAQERPAAAAAAAATRQLGHPTADEAGEAQRRQGMGADERVVSEWMEAVYRRDQEAPAGRAVAASQEQPRRSRKLKQAYSAPPPPPGLLPLPGALHHPRACLAPRAPAAGLRSPPLPPPAWPLHPAPFPHLPTAAPTLPLLCELCPQPWASPPRRSWPRRS